MKRIKRKWEGNSKIISKCLTCTCVCVCVLLWPQQLPHWACFIRISVCLFAQSSKFTRLKTSFTHIFHHISLQRIQEEAGSCPAGTCSRRCRCRGRAPSRWQTRAGSGSGCSLGWRVVLQAPGKLLSQYHCQCVVFSEALMREKEKKQS